MTSTNFITQLPRHRWTGRDVYRFPTAVLLLPVIWYDYRQRRLGKRPDRWHWADELLLTWGYWA
jgi:hypothetical protein